MRSPKVNGAGQAPADRIVGFVRLLRANGIIVSPAESADALRALAAMPAALAAQDAFAAALSGSLVKRAADLPVFHALFAAYFLGEEVGNSSHGGHHDHHGDRAAAFAGLDLLPRPGPAIDGGKPGHQHGARIDLRRYFGEGVARPDHDHHPGDRFRLTWLAGDLHFDREGGPTPGFASRDGQIGLRRVSTTGRPGALQPPHSVVLARDVVLGSAGEHWDEAREELDANLRKYLEELAANGRRVPVSHSGTPAPGLPQEPESSSVPRLPDLSWDRLTMEDLARLERAIGAIGKRLGGAPGRRRTGQRGRLDGRRTARRAATTGGVPFVPVYRARRDDRPRLVVLCDASLSVRGAARFLLALARGAQRQTGRVRSFVFVRDVAEATHALDSPDLGEAIAAVFGGGLLDTAEASDGGAALAAFLQRHGTLLTRRTTLLILGDGRNNGRDAREDALAELRRRCRRIVWLTPEERGSWRLAGCDLTHYAPWCDLVETVRTPADLERLVVRLPR